MSEQEEKNKSENQEEHITQIQADMIQKEKQMDSRINQISMEMETLKTRMNGEKISAQEESGVMEREIQDLRSEIQKLRTCLGKG